MKRLISITVVLAMICAVLSLGALTVSAAESGTWGDLAWVLDDEGKLTISGNGEMDDFEPLSGDAWRAYSSSIKTVVIEEGVTKIGDRAFENCTALESVTIPDGVTAIDNFAFDGCTALKSIAISDSVTVIGAFAFNNTAYYNNANNWEDGVLYIGKYLLDVKSDKSGDYIIKNGTKVIADCAFEFCDALTSVTIPDSVTIIGDATFNGCEALERVTIPDSVTSIGNSAFAGCRALESVTIPDSVITIGYFAFEFCDALENVTIPAGVTSIGTFAFGSCTSLKGIEVADGNTEYLDVDGVLFNKDKTTLMQYPAGRTNVSYTIPDGVTEIGDGAFESCTALKSITIGSSVTKIGNCAFEFCAALKSIIIGSEVTLIGNYAFNSCTALETVYYCGSENRWDRIVITKGNDPLLNANIVYNYILPRAELGDVNGDGCIDNLDAAVILKYDAGLAEEISEVADVNGDGYTDNLDAAKILKYDAGIIDEL